MFINIGEVEEKIKDLSFDEIVHLCKTYKIFVSEDEIDSYSNQFNISKGNAIKEICISCLNLYNEQDKEMEETYNSIIRGFN